MIVELAGGIGLFLLGMLLMTDGLKSLGGNLLRDWLARLTGRALTHLTAIEDAAGTPFPASDGGDLLA